MTKQQLVVQTSKHLAQAGGRGLSVSQLMRITGCGLKEAQGAFGVLWSDFRCWRWYCKKRRCFVYTEPEVQLDADRQFLHTG